MEWTGPSSNRQPRGTFALAVIIVAAVTTIGLTFPAALSAMTSPAPAAVHDPSVAVCVSARDDSWICGGRPGN